MHSRVFVLDSSERVIKACEHIARCWTEALRRKQPLVVSIEPDLRQRSTQQNRRYWAMLGEIAEAVEVDGRRFDTATWHHYFKAQFIGMEDVVLPDRRVIQQPISSAKLSTSEFNAYMERIEAHAANEWGVEFSTVT